MKTLNVTFTDAEYKRLHKAKLLHIKEKNNRISWERFILVKCCVGVHTRL